MGSRNNTLRPSSSASWLGSLATTGPDLRFSTFGAGSPKPSPRRKIGAALFEEDVPAGIGRASVEDELRELRGLEAGAEQGWSVTVAEGPKARSRSRKVHSGPQSSRVAQLGLTARPAYSPTRP